MRRLLHVLGAWLILGQAVLASQATLVVPGSPLSMSGLASFMDSALLSIASCNSGPSAPANGTGAAAFAQECWVDTTTTTWKFQYYDGSSWVQFGALNSSSHVWTPWFGSPGSSAQMFIGQSAAQPAWVSMSGDCTLNASGVIACTKINGITWPSSGTSGGIPYFSGSGTIGSSLALTAHGIVVGEGAGNAPVAITACTSTQIPVGQTSADPACKTASGDVTNDANLVQTIAGHAVTNAKSAQSAGPTVKGNPTGGTADQQDVSPATARSSSLLNIDACTSTGDANGTIAATDRCYYHTALSAARTDTLPAANALNAGQKLLIADPRGVATGSNTVTVQRAGADTINGGTTFPMVTAAFGLAECYSDGTSRWDCQQLGGGSGSGVTSATIAGAGLAVATGTCTITTTGTCTITTTAASQADMEAASSNTVAVTPGTTKFHPGVSKVWARMDGMTGGTCTVRASFGVTSCARAGTGQYTVTFSTAFSSATNYGCNITVSQVGAVQLVPYIDVAPTTTVLSFRSYQLYGGVAVVDADYIMVNCMGDQ